MGMVVNNNIPALQAFNAVNSTSSALQKSIQKLSTGLRINSAADDAAGLAISEKMRAQVRGLDRAVANAQDGMSMIQTAEGALSETHSILQRMRELSVQAANDTLTQNDRQYIQEEINALREEVTRIGNTTQFNKKKLLDGSAAALTTSTTNRAKAVINGGLRELDEFGQKVSKEGNFHVAVTISGGKAQVLKTDVLRLKHDYTATGSGSAGAGAAITLGAIATTANKLYDLEVFWDEQGRFLLEDPQTITITQGDGRSATVRLYQDDTVQDLTDKLNTAISGYVVSNGTAAGNFIDGKGLGQLGSVTNHATYVGTQTSATTGLASVAGTIVIYSSVKGASGELSFSGDEDLIKALSLTQIQKASEGTASITINDAHNGVTIVAAEEITGNRLVGSLHNNIDLEFDTMIGFTAGAFVVSGNGGFVGGVQYGGSGTGYTVETAVGTSFSIHLADNTTVFQIGANEGEDMAVHIGDMRAEALELNKVLVTDREAASRSITIIDRAIDKVSMQRSKIGAYQNRLEHTVNNLTVASENLTAAESRIRDTDMAKEMMNFTKLQIMLQAGTGMLAQANQLPQNVLSLVR